MKIDPNLSARHNSKHGTATGDPIDNPPPRSDTAPKACCHKMGSRNLIVCIDGTANQFGEKNTNVIELYNLILKEHGDNQRTWYNSGIGTYAQPSWKSLNFYKQVLGHTIDLAIAWNFERTIQGAYRWLSDNYEHGDCIFLFGFSRGAFQVRALSAMIDKVGLIYKGNEMQIPFAYELYADPKINKAELTQVGSQQKMCTAERFKRAFSHKDVKVHFIGVWDTVSSIGITRSKDMLPGTVDGMTHVCYFRHALALDERRVKFLPEYAYGGAASKPEKSISTPSRGTSHKDNAPTTDNKDVVDEASANGPSAENADMIDHLERPGRESMGKHPHTLEVWFAGTHSDIGGGNVDNPAMDRNRPPLRWMVYEAGKFGLRMAQFERELSSKEQVEKPNESLTWCWWPLEVLFIKRPTYTRNNGRPITYKPHLGSSRKIHPGQKIHSSFLLTDKTDAQYTPRARPVKDDGSFWQKLREEGPIEWLELDMYEHTQDVMEEFISAKCQGDKFHVLCQIALSRYGRQAVYEKVIEALEGIPELEIKCQLLKSAMDILPRKGSQDSSHLKLTPSFKIHPLVSDLWESSNKHNHEIAQEFVLWFTDPCRFVLDIGTPVMSIAFLPDGMPMVSGLSEEGFQIWDVETGRLVGGAFQGHTSSVMSVAFSPDGRHIVSGSFDNTVRIWDAKTGKPMGESFQGHTDWVRAVAFSSDGRHVVSGSDDQTVRIWDVETGRLVGEPFQGHTDVVSSVGFSPDGKCVVSGSYDKTVQIWDVETGKLVGEPLQGHTRSLGLVTFVVAFSPNSRHVVSGSYDRTVRIWDAKTGKPVGERFRGHTAAITSVAFSPDSRRVVSGSCDGTVCILDAETGKQVGEPLQGHRWEVTSVIFSPDGKQVFSGSHDMTVRIWDVETEEAVGESFQKHEIRPVAFLA